MIYRYITFQYNKIFDGFTAEFKVLDYRMTLDQALEERLYGEYDCVGVYYESGMERGGWMGPRLDFYD